MIAGHPVVAYVFLCRYEDGRTVRVRAMYDPANSKDADPSSPEHMLQEATVRALYLSRAKEALLQEILEEF